LARESKRIARWYCGLRRGDGKASLGRLRILPRFALRFSPRFPVLSRGRIRFSVPWGANMIVGVPKETTPGERRVALVPDLIPNLPTAGAAVLVQAGAGAAAGFLDAAYRDKGARVEDNVLDKADVLLKVQPPTAAEAERVKEGATLIGFLQPYANSDATPALAPRQVTAF